MATAAEMQMIREQRNKRQRDWWHSMSLEERRQRRELYELNAIKRRMQQPEETR